MHVRMVRLTGSPTGVEKRGAVFEREAMPTLREQPGFAGVVVLADPGTGAGAAFTYWESEEAMTASAAALAANRERLMALGVDRGSGRLFVGTSWTTASDREASEAATADLRRRLGEAVQATSIEVEHYEVAFAEMPATVNAPG